MTVDQKGRTAPAVHLFSTSAAFLPESSQLKRLPRRPERTRPADFYAAFEDRALFYDCFDAGNAEIVLVGPPPLNLDPFLKAGRFRALPSGVELAPSWFPSRSTMTTVLKGAATGTTAVEFEAEGLTETIPVQPSQSNVLKGRRVMFTMNKDNDLSWIRTWAQWHCQLHGVDAIVIFDNGSTRYGLEELAHALARVEGLEVVGLVSWPFRYGPVDPAVLSHPYWPNFLQVASFSLMLRRFGKESAGLLNCDVDELVGVERGRDVFMALDQSRDGFVRLNGRWIEAVRDPGAGQSRQALSHLDFHYRRRNPLLAKCANKWVLDPRRTWARNYTIFPMMHRIYGFPRTRALMAPTLSFWHFKGISTNWKEDRTGQELAPADPRRHILDTGWRQTRQAFVEGQSTHLTSASPEGHFLT